MISAFLKKTFDNKQINLVKPLQIYIRDAYGKDKEKEKMGTLKEIQQYRDSCNVTDNSVSPVSAIPKHEKYLSYICILEKRFSWGKSGRGVFSKASKVEVWFKWVDSYRHTKIEQSMDIKLEKFAIIFNLGALMSLHAVKYSEQDEDGLKSACKLFRESGGVFKYLSENAASDSIQFVQNMDIQKDSCRFLSALMLAQAQACFAEMAIRKKMKPKLISALARGTADFFKECVSLIEMTAALKSWVEKGQYNFRSHCQSQQQYYTAIAHYYESIRVSKLAEEGVYGKEIAWLKSANSILQSIGKNSKSKLIPTLQTNRKALLRKLSPRLKEAVKDNNDIYHDPIPNINTLKGVDGRQNVGIIEYKPKLDAIVDPFKNMVPKSIAKKADQLKAELMGEIQTIQLQCNENNDNARAILASLGLPAAVDCVQSQTGLPDSVWERISECKKTGGLKELSTLYARIESINAESWKILQDEVIGILDVEQNIDTQIRTKLGSKWQRTDSMQLQKEYRQQIDVIANHLTTAMETNTKIEKSMKEHETKFVELDKEKDELANELPNVEEIKDNQEAEQLKVFLDELSEIIGKRDQLKEDYEKEVNNLDVSQLFMQNQSATVETIKSKAKISLTEITKQIDDGIKQQTECLEKISNQNELFVASKQNDPKQTQREQMIHILNETCVKFKDNQRHLTEGLKFYSDLMADYLLPLKDEIDNYCAARESERDLLLADLGQNVQKLGIDTNAKISSNNNNIQIQEQKNEPKQIDKPPPQQQQVYNPPANPTNWNCPACTFQNPNTNDKCSMCNANNPNPNPKPKPGYNPYYSQQPPPQQQQPPQQGYNPHYNQPPPQQQNQPPPQQGYQQPPQQQGYGQPPPQQGYGQPPQQGYYQQQPPPQQGYYQQQPPQGYYQQQPPQQQYQYQQQPPPQQGGYNPVYGQQPPPQQGGYNPNYQPNNNNNNNQPSAPPQ